MSIPSDELKIREVLWREYGLHQAGYDLRYLTERDGLAQKNVWRFAMKGVFPPTKIIYGATMRTMLRAIRRKFTPGLLLHFPSPSNSLPTSNYPVPRRKNT